MPKYNVEVQQTISTFVEVEADSPEAAADKVSMRDFELPPRNNWEGLKDWYFAVYDEDVEELLYEMY